MSYLVDSDWIVDALAGVDSALKVLEELSEEGLAVSIISVGEILEGAYGFPDPDSHRLRFRQFLRGSIYWICRSRSWRCSPGFAPSFVERVN